MSATYLFLNLKQLNKTESKRGRRGLSAEQLATEIVAVANTCILLLFENTLKRETGSSDLGLTFKQLLFRGKIFPRRRLELRMRNFHKV
jgi:hypothetical protein